MNKIIFLSREKKLELSSSNSRLPFFFGKFFNKDTINAKQKKNKIENITNAVVDETPE